MSRIPHNLKLPKLGYVCGQCNSSCEAHWCLYLFDLQEHFPAVVHLQVHLHNQHSVVFNTAQDGNIQDVLNSRGNHDTTLTGWFKANAELDMEDLHNLLYQDFPTMMVWNKETWKWTVRKDGKAIGRMYHAPPTSGECFYLRLLLTCVKGATSFDHFKSFEGV